MNRVNDSLGTHRIEDNVIRNLRDDTEITRFLLKDRARDRNILWATDSYKTMGPGYEADTGITLNHLKGKMNELIRPRAQKLVYEQKKRTKGKAEVFTPTWIIKKMVDAADSDYVSLPLEDYLQVRWLEITCGEAPFMVSRYDTITGDPIPIQERVGFLDRKLQRINQEIHEPQSWYKAVVTAYQTSYGYEYQGDSLLLARENLFFTFKDYYEAKFHIVPPCENQLEIASLISYAVIQMDGLDYTVPYTEKKFFEEGVEQLSLFEDARQEEQVALDLYAPPDLAKIKNWRSQKMVCFKDIAEGDETMKFDVVIGNPPFDEETEGNSTSSRPIYPAFMEQAFRISDRTCLITPGRFLFNAGQTSEIWNLKMLNDPHFKVLFYEQLSSMIFQTTDIKGGVAISYYDSSRNFEPIRIFISIPELSSIYHKVKKIRKSNPSISEIAFSRTSYKLSGILHEEHPDIIHRLSKGHANDIATNIFDTLPDIFLDKKLEDSKSYIQILGKQANNRVYKWVRRDYIRPHANLDKWKVFLPKSNGSGVLGEVLSTPLIGAPLIGANETFMSFGSFDSEIEAKNLLLFFKTKFARAMLGVLKVTQDNPIKVWAEVPLENFKSNSDIDWSKSISEIDQQLYKKYGLSKEEIDFIETKVKEMD